MKKENSKIYKSEIHQLIPGGAHTYSKGDDQFPENAPAAISHGKGAYVWDLDGNKFLDCSMGLTSVSLGHAYKPVTDEVKKELDKGVNFQRPSSLERKMAKEFLSLVPQHDRIKFAKNGSTVTTAAVKLARAKTGRKLVAFPEDHPFYSYDDWFISSTPCNSGVPEEIQNLSVTFKSCDLASLKALFEKYPDQIACVITEPEKSFCSNCTCAISNEEFLREAISYTQKQGAIFILDEIVTGFKVHLPGAISKYKLNPDLTTWGKGIANGFSFCALTGKKEIMDLGGIKQQENEKVFLISTTHGGETHAMAAALTTIKEFKKHNIINHVEKTGNLFIKYCNEKISAQKLEEYVEIIPCWWQPIIIFKGLDKKISAGLRTLMLQEMIKRNVLFQGIFVISYSHKEQDIMFFIEAFDSALTVYKKALDQGFEFFLEGEIIKPVFRKFN
ncbi:glutamate-1-semialdehyde 2,1-aminomutase [Flavobacteriaceae bacterium]|nr:glutamate-1-semialdehyde 2,1-aminomutase [Flavobacteriaceae bacterium]